MMNEKRTNLAGPEMLRASWLRPFGILATVGTVAALAGMGMSDHFPDLIHALAQSLRQGPVTAGAATRAPAVTEPEAPATPSAPAEPVAPVAEATETSPSSSQSEARIAPGTDRQTEGAAPPVVAEAATETARGPASLTEGRFSGLVKELHGKFDTSKALPGLRTEASSTALSISFSTDRIFPPGAASLSASSQEELTELVSLIRDQARGLQIQVQGHTDDTPIVRNRKQFGSNWELGGARAAALVRLFEAAGIGKERLEVVSYGSARPLFPNQDARRTENRRLVIRLLNGG